MGGSILTVLMGVPQACWLISGKILNGWWLGVALYQETTIWFKCPSNAKTDTKVGSHQAFYLGPLVDVLWKVEKYPAMFWEIKLIGWFFIVKSPSVSLDYKELYILWQGNQHRHRPTHLVQDPCDGFGNAVQREQQEAHHRHKPQSIPHRRLSEFRFPTQKTVAKQNICNVTL